MNQQEDTPATLTAFWPGFLLSVALVVFLGWQAIQVTKQYLNLQRGADQQKDLAGQVAQTENRLQQLSMELIALAKTDADAKTIVNKYRISFNPPAQGVPAPPAPAAPPAALPAVPPAAPPAPAAP